MARVLVGGGAGFIGFHLARAMAERGWHVDILDNFSRAVRDMELELLLERHNVRCLSCSLLDRAAVENLDTDYDLIFHLAAIVGVQHVLNRSYEVLTHNVEMTTNAIALARRQKALKRFVFASTSEVYAGTQRQTNIRIPTPEDTPLTITDTGEPRTSYMLSKIYGEAMCCHARLPFTIVRPHNVYGPRMGMSHAIPELLKRAVADAEGEPLQVYSVGHSRTFCYIDDVVELLIRIAQNADCSGRVLNLGSQGPEVKIGELAKIILETVGKRREIRALPDTTGSPVRRCPDMTITTALTNYSSKVDLRKGIHLTYTWYKDHVFSGRSVSAA